MVEQGRQGAQGRGMRIQAHTLQVLPAKEGQHLLPGAGGLEAPSRKAGAGGLEVRQLRRTFRQDQLLGVEPLQGGVQGLFAVAGNHPQGPRGQLEQGQAPGPAHPVHGAEPAGIVVQPGAGRDDPLDGSRQQALDLLGLGRGLGDGRRVARCQQLGQVGLQGEVGHPAHGRLPHCALAPQGEGDLEHRRRPHRILPDDLVEVPHARQQHSVARLPLEARDLLHHRSGHGGLRKRGY